MTRVLVAEDESEVRGYLGLALDCEGYAVEFAENGEEVLKRLENGRDDISVLLLDLMMPMKDGFETLSEVRQHWPGLPVITLSGCCTPANVAWVLKTGAVDFLWKPVGHSDLVRAVQSALDSPRIHGLTGHERRSATSTVACDKPAGGWSRQIEFLLHNVGASDAPVLLRGETGVGKEVLARQLHAHSKRADQPFLKLNCAALPSELVESELFGYEKGAFTGAFRTTPGKFELANRGAILLDEIGDMDFRLQAKLLQVLQDREYLRLGAKETCRVDVRVLAATHCDLEKAMAEGRFRQDLYYRLNIVEVYVPPLRERKDEILALAKLFARRHAPLDAPELPHDLCEALLEHDWPGNVRELENVIRKFLIFRNAGLIVTQLRKTSRVPAGANLSARNSADRKAPMQLETIERTRINSDFANGVREDSVPHPFMPLSARSNQGEKFELRRPLGSSVFSQDLSLRSSTLEQVDQARKQAEMETITSTLNTTLWNRKQAAKLLNIEYKALLYKMKKLGIGKANADPNEE
jgi:two-component system response regulator AtoC